MKALIILFFISSCALWEDYKDADINWLGTPRNKPAMEKRTEILVPQTSVGQKLVSTDREATLTLSNNLVGIEISRGMVSYKEGHSIEVDADGSAAIFTVKPTEIPNTVVLLEPQKFQGFLVGKKKLTVELILLELGSTKYHFSL